MWKNKGYLLVLLAGLILGIVAGQLGLQYAFLLAAMTLLPIFLIWKPELGLYLLAGYGLLDFAFRKVGGGILAGPWDELLFILIVGSFLVNLIITSQSFGYRLTALDVPMLIFFGVSIFLLLINSPEMYIAIDGLRVVLQHLLWYFVAVNLIKDRLTVTRLLNMLILVTAGIALYGIYQYIVGVEIPTTWYDSRFETSITTRIFSIIGSPNILGSLLVLMLPITLSMLLNEKRRLKRIIYLGLMVSMLLALVFTLSRGAWLAFALAAVIYAVLKDKRLIIPVVAGGILLLFAVPQIGDRIAYMLSPQYMVSSATGGRIARWTMAVEVIKTSPIFGVGLGRFGGATAARHIPDSLYADNFYLKTMAEMGIVGFSAFILLLYRGCIESLKGIRKINDVELYNVGIGIFAGIAGVLAHNGVENVFEVPMMTAYFWLLIAVVISFRFITPQEGKR